MNLLILATQCLLCTNIAQTEQDGTNKQHGTAEQHCTHWATREQLSNTREGRKTHGSPGHGVCVHIKDPKNTPGWIHWKNCKEMKTRLSMLWLFEVTTELAMVLFFLLSLRTQENFTIDFLSSHERPTWVRVVSGPNFRDKLMIFGIFGKLSLFCPYFGCFFGKKSG